MSIFSIHRQSAGVALAGNHPGLILSTASIILFSVGVIFTASVSALTVEDIPGYDAGKIPDNSISFDLEGCRLENDDDTYPDPDFVCGDPGYTDGNLGKLYNELDLVPHTITANTAGSDGEQNYQLILGADSLVNDGSGSKPLAIGYDKIGGFKLREGDEADCDLGVDYTNQEIDDYGIGGAITQVVQVVDIIQAPDTVCTWDYYKRLAITSSQISGSSNRSFVIAGTGAQSIPIPDVQNPVQFAKDMSASQGAGYIWTVSKNSSPASINFGDTCDVDPSTPVQASIDVIWSRLGPNLADTVKLATTFEIFNSARRALDFEITDKVFSGGPLEDITSYFNVGESNCVLDGGVIALTVNANTVGTCKAVWDVPANLLTDSPNVSDTAIAEIFDPLFPEDEDCVCALTANDATTVSTTGAEENASANVEDTEYLKAGTQNVYFEVASVTIYPDGDISPPVSTAMDPNEPVDWVSCPEGGEAFCLSGSGMVTFNKNVYFTKPFASGVLYDVASVTGSDGYTPDNPTELNIPISSNPQADLTISKTIEYALDDDDANLTFCFSVVGDNGYSLTVAPNGGETGDDGDPPCITFTSGDGPTETVDVNNIPPGNYTVTEITIPTGWTPVAASQDVDLTAESFAQCSDTASFTNNVITEPVSKVVKITLPMGDGLKQGWEFTLDVPEAQEPDEVCTTNEDGECVFTTPIWPEYLYTISETDDRIEEGGGWDDDGTAGDCSFTAEWPEDYINPKTFICTWTNTQRGTVVIEKDTLPTPTFELFDFSEDISATGAFQLADGGDTTFNNVVPGTYAVRESDPSPACALSDNPCAEQWDLLSVGCVDSDDGGTDSAQSVSDPNEATIELDPGETVTCTFTNQQRGTVTVNKTENFLPAGDGDWTFEVRQGASAASAGAVLASDSTDASGEVDFGGLYFVPGDYQLCERGVEAGWQISLLTLPGAFNLPDPEQDGFCAPFTLSAGEDEVFSLENTPPDDDEDPGVAHTIGFWRNWSGECTNGNQEDVLGETLPGITLGLMEWSDPIEESGTNFVCDAVQILSKRNIDGDNRAFDPAYALASQFLAYLLNIESEAGCAMPTEAARAQELLGDTLPDGVGFDGTDLAAATGKGKKKTVLYVQNSDKGEWISLASLFDQYNNMETSCFNP